MFSWRPLKKCPSRFDLTSESEILIAFFFPFFAIYNSPCCNDYFLFQTCLAYQSLGASSVFRFALDGDSANDMVLTSSFLLLRSQGYKMLWNNYSTAIFKTFFKGLCYHDNLIIRWLPKGAVFGLVTRKLIWGGCNLDWWLEYLKSALSSETPLTVPWGPIGWGPARKQMRMQTAKLALRSLHSN